MCRLATRLHLPFSQAHLGVDMASVNITPYILVTSTIYCQSRLFPMGTMNHSPLLRLSAELRNVIYEHTFTSQYAVTLCSGKVQHPLTKTCRQIRHETLPMYYAVTKFNAHLDDGPATPLAKWLKTQAPELVLCMNGLVIWVSLIYAVGLNVAYVLSRAGSPGLRGYC